MAALLDNHADGLTPDQAAEEYPRALPDVNAAIAFAAALAREEEPVPLR